jgi:hypothetical protein
MMSNLRHHLASEVIDDRLRVAAQRRRVEMSAPLADTAMEAHRRQRALVRLSLLLARRQDPATHRRLG